MNITNFIIIIIITTPETSKYKMQSLIICLLLAVPRSEAAVLSYTPSLGSTFSIPRLRQNTSRIRDGFAAHAKAFGKYGWTDLNIKSNVFSSTTPVQGQTGTVNVSAEEYDAAYIAPITIGTGASAQTLNIDFDTGSSDFWVFSSLLGPGDTTGHNVFDPVKSETFHNASGLDWAINYGDGSGAAGVVGIDKVDIGGVTVTSQAVELATAVSSSFIKDIDSDGLVGLAFKKINRGGCNSCSFFGHSNTTQVKPNKQETFFDNIKSSLKRPLFTVDLRTDGSGSYDFGFIDQAKYSGNLTHIGINNSLGFWQFASPGFEVDGVEYNNKHGSPAIAGKYLDRLEIYKSRFN